MLVLLQGLGRWSWRFENGWIRGLFVRCLGERHAVKIEEEEKNKDSHELYTATHRNL